MSRNSDWIKQRIVKEEIERYLVNGDDFIDHSRISGILLQKLKPSKNLVREIFSKSLQIETLTPEEVFLLMNLEDEELVQEMKVTAAAVKKKVYDNRIVTFAPLYLSDHCVNNCLYCGFKSENKQPRRQLNTDEIINEVKYLAGTVGHKRLIVVYGEHPDSDIDYIVSTLKTIYGVKVPARKGYGSIRRCNVNAPSMSIEDLSKLKDAGIGTYQVFQETYHKPTYDMVHPKGMIKNDYRWRLYSMHRAMESGIDDVGIGALFGLYDWRYEVLALVMHALELEHRFGVGPHTISFPRLEPSHDSLLSRTSPYRVSDMDFERLVLVLRLAVPYTGLILTARESEKIRDRVIDFGCTQLDASSRTGVGSYSSENIPEDQNIESQQFLLGDTRSLDEVIRMTVNKGIIMSFCTAGYRCGRTGDQIMKLLKSGRESCFCKMNAILTFKEWLDDFACEGTYKTGMRLINREIMEVKENLEEFSDVFNEKYQFTMDGSRDNYL